MAVAQVIVGFFTIGTLFVIQLVGTATSHWVSLKVLGSEVAHAGLFKFCLADWSGLAKLATGDDSLVCRDYSDFNSLLSFSYYAVVVLECLSVLLFFIGSIIGIVGCCSSGNSGRNYVLNMARLAMSAAILSLVGVIWFVVQNDDSDTFSDVTSSSVSVDFAYSLDLCAASSAMGIVFSIVMCIVGSNMDLPVNGTVIQPAAGPHVMVMHTQTQQQMPVYNPGVFTTQTNTVAIG